MAALEWRPRRRAAEPPAGRLALEPRVQPQRGAPLVTQSGARRQQVELDALQLLASPDALRDLVAQLAAHRLALALRVCASLLAGRRDCLCLLTGKRLLLF